MTVKIKPRKPVTKAQYPMFFSMLRKAAQNLSLTTSQEVEDYRRKVMLEEAGCSSIKEMNCKSDFDACIRRFAADAGDYVKAVDIGLQETQRQAFVVKVLCCQIMQLKGGSESEARDYLDGIINQARIPCGVSTDDNSFWMDVAPASLRHLLQILDTYRRKLIRANFPRTPVKFDPSVRYEIAGPIRIRHFGIPSSYYSSQPFAVNVRSK